MLNLIHWTILVDMLKAQAACGASPSTLVTQVQEEWAIYSWPNGADELEDLLKALAFATWSWEVVLGAGGRLVKKGDSIAWRRLYSVLRPLLETADARYGFIENHLKDLYRQKSLKMVHVAVENIREAGIHPASLLLCAVRAPETAEGNRVTKSIAKALEAVSSSDLLEWDWKYRAIDGIWENLCSTSLDDLVFCNAIGLNPPSGSRFGNPIPQRLGDRILAGDTLSVKNMPDLRSIGNDLHVYGCLFLEDLRNLSSLGDRIRVEGHLDIRNCPKLQSLPDSLYVGGKIVLQPDESNRELVAQVPQDKLWTLRHQPEYPDYKAPRGLGYLIFPWF